MNRSAYLYVLLALTVLIWGNSFVVVKMAIDDGALPVAIAMGRFVIASAIFGCFVILRRPRAIEKSDARLFVFLAFVGVGVYYIFQYYGVKFAGPAISAILVTLLCPIMIFAISYFRFGERVTATQKTGLGCAAAGSYFVITDGSVEFISNWQGVVGGLFGVICAIFWAMYTVEGKRAVQKYKPFTATAYLTLIGSFMLVPFAAADAHVNGPVQFPLTYFFAVVYLGVFCTVLGYVFWFKALTGLSASKTGATLSTSSRW
ncbi:MAG: DMT family transporter [Thermoplasmata archaeon]